LQGVVDAYEDFKALEKGLCRRRGVNAGRLVFVARHKEQATNEPDCCLILDEY
jgi:hypothetical protein